MYLKKIGIGAVFAVAWLTIWEICAIWIDLPFAIPRVLPTLKVFVHLFSEVSFWRVILYSFVRILIGLSFGVLLGVLLAILSIWIPPLHIGFSQAMAAMKATPVASFIMLLWILIGRDTVPIAIALLMVVPLIYQGITDGYRERDPQLSEMLAVYQVSLLRKFQIFLLPEVFRFFLPSLIQSTALAWKAGIAAEIIAYTANSIGKEISDAKNFFEGERMFAWTLAVILLSLLIEFVLNSLHRRYRRYADRNQES